MLHMYQLLPMPIHCRHCKDKCKNFRDGSRVEHAIQTKETRKQDEKRYNLDDDCGECRTLNLPPKSDHKEASESVPGQVRHQADSPLVSWRLWAYKLLSNRITELKRFQPLSGAIGISVVCGIYRMTGIKLQLLRLYIQPTHHRTAYHNSPRRDVPNILAVYAS